MLTNSLHELENRENQSILRILEQKYTRSSDDPDIVAAIEGVRSAVETLQKELDAAYLAAQRSPHRRAA